MSLTKIFKNLKFSITLNPYKVLKFIFGKNDKERNIKTNEKIK